MKNAVVVSEATLSGFGKYLATDRYLSGDRSSAVGRNPRFGGKVSTGANRQLACIYRRQFVGTRRFSSSKKLSTTTILGGDAF
jgi:hypothetical protein